MIFRYLLTLLPALILTCGLLSVSESGGVAEGQAWVQDPGLPVRTVYVCDQGSGDGTTIATCDSLADAFTNAAAGDHIWLKGGRYTGLYTISVAGTSAAPIVTRCMTGHRCILDGEGLNVNEEYNWIWGLEFTEDTDTTGTGAALNFVDSGNDSLIGVHVINNIIHDLTSGSSGFGYWDTGSNQVAYGNMIWDIFGCCPNNAHALYAQNNFADHGVKYFVHNAVFDQTTRNGDANSNGAQANLHIFGTTAAVSGFHLEGNISENGQTVWYTNADALPTHTSVMKDNFFYHPSGIRFDLGGPGEAPFQGTVTGNLFGRVGFQIGWWGEDTGTAPPVAKPANVTWTGNKFHYGSGATSRVWEIGVLGYTNGSLTAWTPSTLDFSAGDDFDANTFWDPPGGTSTVQFDYHYYDGSVTYTQTLKNFANWVADTATSGDNMSDTGTFNADTTAPDSINVICNDYEHGKGFIAIYNYSLANPVTSVDFSSCCSTGRGYQLWDAASPTNRVRETGPLMVGNCEDNPINIVSGGAEFMGIYVEETHKITSSAPKIVAAMRGRR